uniref:DUF862 domain-containing protein n=1 Tax=Rhabditophanes sp. KR3021 TaxID=114890 RepID=A0AC35TW14_9BILA
MVRDAHHSEPAYLNVYTLHPGHFLNKVGPGLFHSGIEVYGREYMYTGHQKYETGLMYITPKSGRKYNPNFEFKTAILLGKTSQSLDQVKTLIGTMGGKYRGDAYHLLRRNCNHFTDELCRLLLCNKPIPKWVNRTATFAHNVPMFYKIFDDNTFGMQNPKITERNVKSPTKGHSGKKLAGEGRNGNRSVSSFKAVRRLFKQEFDGGERTLSLTRKGSKIDKHPILPKNPSENMIRDICKADKKNKLD